MDIFEVLLTLLYKDDRNSINIIIVTIVRYDIHHKPIYIQ